VAHVLCVAAFQIGDPMAFLVLVEADDAALHGLLAGSKPPTDESRDQKLGLP
jgi:hypothetical protein